MSAPGLGWPVTWVIVALYLTGAAFVDAFIDTEADRPDARSALPFCLAGLYFAHRWYLRRMHERALWREGVVPGRVPTRDLRENYRQ